MNYGRDIKMDKRWMHETNRTNTLYSEGVKQFINMARGHADRVGRIKCPCCKCTNRYCHHINMVETHLIVNRFDASYKDAFVRSFLNSLFV